MWMRSRDVEDESTEVVVKAVQIKEPAQRGCLIEESRGAELGGGQERRVTRVTVPTVGMPQKPVEENTLRSGGEQWKQRT